MAENSGWLGRRPATAAIFIPGAVFATKNLPPAVETLRRAQSDRTYIVGESGAKNLLSQSRTAEPFRQITEQEYEDKIHEAFRQIGVEIEEVHR